MDKKIIAIAAPVEVTAGESKEGQTGPAKFATTFYTGGALRIAGWDLPVVVDLAGLEQGNVLVANLDHDPAKRVGNFTVANDGKSLVAMGTATAATAARDEVVNSAIAGYQWQSSLEVQPSKVEQVKAGKTVQVNGQTFEGPLYVTRKGTLKGFGFVSHGADDNTSVTIAAKAASHKENVMKPEVKAWAEKMLLDVDSMTPEQIAAIEANYQGRAASDPAPVKAGDPFEARKIEAKRRREILDIADKMCEDYQNAGRVDDIDEIRKMANHAIEAKMSAQEFRIELYESSVPPAHTVAAPRHRNTGLSNRVLEAAICMAGRLCDDNELVTKHRFTDQELQTAHDHFKGRIGLKQLFLVAAQSNGYHGHGFDITIEVQRAAFGMVHPMQRASGFSTISLSTILSNTANKFLREGWNSVDMTPLRIAAIRPVTDFKQITTVSLTGALQFEKVGQDGQIKHGTVDELTYTNQADTYARMLAITRKDQINDDLGALTAAPRRLGRGGGLKLNDIFWTEFLNNSSFFTSGNSNVNEGVADMTVGGLAATETVFMNQTDPDGKPLGVMAEIILVPTALKASASTLMSSDRLITGSTTTQGDGNIWKGRFRVESSPYMSNSSYTGYSAAAWYMLANPSVLPVIEIAALNGRVEPVIETADADFNVLGVQMRGYSDIGVNLQEYRGGVRADGGAS